MREILIAGIMTGKLLADEVMKVINEPPKPEIKRRSVKRSLTLHPEGSTREKKEKSSAT